MVGTSLSGVALAGFGLGLAHALDADHVMAVTGMSSRRPGLRTALGYASRWGLGHGLTLLGIGASVLLMGMAVPESLSHYAERAVGIALIGIALVVLWDLWRGTGRQAKSTPPGLGQNSLKRQACSQGTGVGALLIGVLHGAAGSAPLLAVVPLMQLNSPWLGLAYLMVFGFGVVIAMAVIGGVLGLALQRLDSRRNMGLSTVRLVVAGLSAVIGAMFLAG